MAKQVKRPVIVDGDQSAAATSGVNGNRVHFTMAKTINIGNYESMRVEYGESRVVEDGQTWESARSYVVKNVMVQLQVLISAVAESMT